MPDIRDTGMEGQSPFLRPAAGEIRRRRARSRPRLEKRRVLALAGLAFLAVLSVAGARLFLHSRAVSVRRVTFAGVTRIPQASLDPVSRALAGRNLLTLDLSRVEDRLRQVSPWVRSATVRRSLPSRIDIEIEERRPVARLADGSALISEDGVLLPPQPARPADAGLPFLSVAVASTARPEALARGIELLALLAGGSRPLAPRVAAVDVSDPDDLVLHLSDADYAVHLGDGDFVTRLNRFQNSEPLLRERYAGIRTVDLRFRDRVVVSPVAPAAAKEASGGSTVPLARG